MVAIQKRRERRRAGDRQRLNAGAGAWFEEKWDRMAGAASAQHPMAGRANAPAGPKLHQATEIHRETVVAHRHVAPAAVPGEGLQPADTALRQNGEQPAVDMWTRGLLHPRAIDLDEAVGHVIGARRGRFARIMEQAQGRNAVAKRVAKNRRIYVQAARQRVEDGTAKSFHIGKITPRHRRPIVRHRAGRRQRRRLVQNIPVGGQRPQNVGADLIAFAVARGARLQGEPAAVEMSIFGREIALPERPPRGLRHLEKAQQTSFSGARNTHPRRMARHHHETNVEGGRANRLINGITPCPGVSEQRPDVDNGNAGNGGSR
ncbi:MAG: hypothetical protein VX784_02530 [Pseudomonadota bacterium]|nr:hypothetical protein [Pseudomonadota bacterium]